MVTKGERWGVGDKLGVWDYNIHSTIYQIDKQQRPTVQHKLYIQYLVINYNGKESEKNIHSKCI